MRSRPVFLYALTELSAYRKPIRRWRATRPRPAPRPTPSQTAPRPKALGWRGPDGWRCLDLAGVPAETERAARQRPVPTDRPVTADLEVGPAELVLDLLVALLNGLIASDKFCWIRGGRLRLGWWRRPLRLRQDKGATLPTETSGSGRGGHAAHLADPAGDQRAARRAGAVGSGLPARVALDGTAGRSSGPSSTRGDDRCE